MHRRASEVNGSIRGKYAAVVGRQYPGASVNMPMRLQRQGQRESHCEAVGRFGRQFRPARRPEEAIAWQWRASAWGPGFPRRHDSRSRKWAPEKLHRRWCVQWASAMRDSGKWAPSASTRLASSGSSATSQTSRRSFATGAIALASSSRLAYCLARRTTRLPGGSARTDFSGSSVRSSSVRNTSAGSAVSRLRLRQAAALANLTRASPSAM
jgi:hypothetical protein